MSGNNFAGGVATIEIGGISFDAVVNSSTKISFTIPDIEIGSYNFNVVIAANGFAGNFNGSILFLVDTVTPNTSQSL